MPIHFPGTTSNGPSCDKAGRHSPKGFIKIVIASPSTNWPELVQYSRYMGVVLKTCFLA